jgi:hypothetical protein
MYELKSRTGTSKVGESCVATRGNVWLWAPVMVLIHEWHHDTSTCRKFAAEEENNMLRRSYHANLDF